MQPKEKTFSDVQFYLNQQGIAVSNTDMQRPWGGFFVIDEKNNQVELTKRKKPCVY